MVEFCGSCGTSLPKGDLTIRKGKLFVSGDYTCPTCGKLANPKAAEHKHVVEPGDKDIVIKKGKASTE